MSSNEVLPPQHAAIVSAPQPWKVLVVDDDEEVRILTRMTLESFRFRERGLLLLEADSAHRAKAILEEHPDVAVALIDVVMETDHAGLDLVRWIREQRGNRLIRLLIRTGQAGQHPASTVISDYEINDYWEKTELTFGRLITSLTTSLRGYDDLVTMNRRTLQLRQWADRFPDLLGAKDWNSLLRLIMLRLRELFPENVLSAFVCRNDGSRWPLLSGTGNYPAGGAADVLPHLDEARAALLLEAWDQQGLAQAPVGQALYFETSSGEGNLFFLDLPPIWDDFERNVARLVLQNFRAVLENRVLINDLENKKSDLAASLHKQEDVAKDLHHRFQSSLQVVLSFSEIESKDRSGVNDRSPLAGVQRRLYVLSLLHTQMQRANRPSGVDVQALLQSLVDHDRSYRLRPGDGGIEYWGVPVQVEGAKAFALAMAAVEMIDYVLSPRFRTNPVQAVQVVLSDGPRALSVSRRGGDLKVGVGLLEWEMLSNLSAQIGGRLSIETDTLRLEF